MKTIGRTRRLATAALVAVTLAVLMFGEGPGSALAAGRCATSAGGVEQRIASFWQCVGALGPSDVLLAEDLGGWAQNVIERDPSACIRVTDFQSSTAAMQAGLDTASAGIPPAPPKSADVEARISRFWQRVNALGPSDSLAATDVGQWALNVIDRDPSRRIRVDDFRASTAGMQAAFDGAKASGASCKPTVAATPTPTPTPKATPTPTPTPTASPTARWPFGNEWGFDYNADGTRLDLLEPSRSKASDGTTQVTYKLVVAGMPRTAYYAWQKRLGRPPELLAGPFTPDASGVVASVVAAHLFKGEAFEITLVSSDGFQRVFGRVVPFPIVAGGTGNCRVVVELISSNGDAFAMVGVGYLPGETVTFYVQSSGYRVGYTRIEASPNGMWVVLVEPAGIFGAPSGTLVMDFIGATCKRSATFDWGPGALVYQ